MSLADPDARPIVKGKLGKPVQFGYKTQIIEAEGGFVTDYTVERGNPPDADADALLPAVRRHKTRFRRAPAIVATDRGYDTAANHTGCRDLGVRNVAIPKRGKISADR
ncbi:MAG: ISNCY family transposase, partial [Thermaerobacter sp.]|nr:ISNCY family transposase [Thermaerobacter sp.]